jgi:hypothetical protein
VLIRPAPYQWRRRFAEAEFDALAPRARGGSLTPHYSTLDQLDDLLRRLRAD